MSYMNNLLCVRKIKYTPVMLGVCAVPSAGLLMFSCDISFEKFSCVLSASHIPSLPSHKDTSKRLCTLIMLLNTGQNN